MYKTTVYFTEQSLDGTFGHSDPSVWGKKNCLTLDDAKDIDGLIKEAIEVEGFGGGTPVLVEMVIEKDGKYVDRDESIMVAKVARTKEPSRFIMWPKWQKPHIFGVDWSMSSYELKTA